MFKGFRVRLTFLEALKHMGRATNLQACFAMCGPGITCDMCAGRGLQVTRTRRRPARLEVCASGGLRVWRAAGLEYWGPAGRITFYALFDTFYATDPDDKFVRYFIHAMPWIPGPATRGVLSSPGKNLGRPPIFDPFYAARLSSPRPTCPRTSAVALAAAPHS